MLLLQRLCGTKHIAYLKCVSACKSAGRGVHVRPNIGAIQPQCLTVTSDARKAPALCAQVQAGYRPADFLRHRYGALAHAAAVTKPAPFNSEGRKYLSRNLGVNISARAR